MPPLFALRFSYNAPATTETYTLSLHDALPISRSSTRRCSPRPRVRRPPSGPRTQRFSSTASSPESARENAERSEEHTSELQSLAYLVCRLLLEKKNQRSSQVRRKGRQPHRN